MAFKAKGPRSRTRQKLRKKIKGRPKVNDMLRDFSIGEKVTIKIEPSIHSAMPYPRYHGRIAEVVEKKKRTYVVRLKDGRKTKKFTCHPVHLKKVV